MRIDGLFRRKASTSINEYVVVRKAEIKNVMSIVLAPVHMRLNVDEEFTNRSIGLIGRKSVWVKIILGDEKGRGTQGLNSVPSFASTVCDSNCFMVSDTCGLFKAQWRHRRSRF